MYSGHCVLHVCTSALSLDRAWKNVTGISGWTWCLQIVGSNYVVVPLFILQAVSFIKVIYRDGLQRLLESAFIEAFFFFNMNWRTIAFSTTFFFFVFTWLSSSMCDQCALSWTRGMIYTICLHLAVPTVMHWAFCLPCLPAGSLWRNLDWYMLLSTSGARLFCKMQIKVAFCSWTSGCF